MTGETVENNGGQQGTGASVLENMPSFEEHMRNTEKDASIGEKYFEQAKAERAKWIEKAQADLARAKALEPKDVRTYILGPDGHSWAHTEEGEFLHRPLDEGDAKDMAGFEKYKAGKIHRAEEDLREDENTDLNKLAKACRNREMIGQIAAKLESGEDFSKEETEFLGDGPETDRKTFDMDRFMTPDVYYEAYHGLVELPSYDQLLNLDDNEGWGRSEFATVARAQMREMARHDQVLLHENEEVQAALAGMEARREDNPFAGETNLNSATGEERTFTLEDNYPRLEGETEGAYASRLKRISLRTRLVEKRG